MRLEKMTKAELIREVRRIQARYDALERDRDQNGGYGHLTGAERRDAITSSHMRAGGNIYGG